MAGGRLSSGFPACTPRLGSVLGSSGMMASSSVRSAWIDYRRGIYTIAYTGYGGTICGGLPSLPSFPTRSAE